jgi:hypothetical protein
MSEKGTTYTSTGEYEYTTLSAGGCDFTSILDLTIHTSSSFTESVTACDAYTWNGDTYTSSGVYTISTVNAAGCDSTATLNRIVETIDTTVSLIRNQLVADDAAGSYQRIDCNNDQYITGATERFFNVMETGSCRVQINRSNCIAISRCIDVILDEVCEKTSEALYLYPNPTRGKVTLNPACVHKDSKIWLSDLTGRRYRVNIIRNPAAIELDLGGLKYDMYIINIEGKNGFSQLKVVKM